VYGAPHRGSGGGGGTAMGVQVNVAGAVYVQGGGRGVLQYQRRTQGYPQAVPGGPTVTPSRHFTQHPPLSTLPPHHPPREPSRNFPRGAGAPPGSSGARPQPGCNVQSAARLAASGGPTQGGVHRGVALFSDLEGTCGLGEGGLGPVGGAPVDPRRAAAQARHAQQGEGGEEGTLRITTREGGDSGVLQPVARMATVNSQAGESQ